MTKLQSRRRFRGFTLVELLIVIIIIAVLAVVVIPKFAESGLRSRESALRANLKLYRNAVELFRQDTGLFPLALADLAETSAPSNGRNAAGTSTALNAANWKGPYVERVEKCPVSGSDFTYSIAPPVGRVTAPSGTALDGTNYNTW